MSSLQMKNTQMGNIQTYQLQMINSGGGGGKATKHKLGQLPNENIQTYQLQIIDSRRGGGVNYQMQIMTKLPNENIQTYQL